MRHGKPKRQPMMKKRHREMTATIFCLAILTTAPPVFSATLFEQGFSVPDSVINDYVNATAPSKNQFTLINTNNSGTWSVSEGRLTLAKTGSGNAYVKRTVDLEECSTRVLSFSMDLDFTFAVPEGTRLLTGSIGSDTTADGAWLAYGIDAANGENTWMVFGDRQRNTFSGPQTLRIFLNGSDTGMTYTAPDGESVVLPPEKWDLWVGKTRAISGKSAMNATLKPAQFGFSINNDVEGGIFAFDNFHVQSISE